MKLAIAAAALFLASPAYAEYVEIPFSGTLSSGYGGFTPGQTFSGKLSYDRFLYSQDEIQLYDGDVRFSFSIGDFSYFSPVAYTTFDPSTGTFSTSGARGDGTSLSFFGLTNTPGYVPSAKQFAGAKGTLTFSDVSGDGEGNPIFSGGEGTAVVPPVPEPSTWVAMCLGLALAIGAARYRRREPRVTFSPA
jgi:hypothetical protein